MVAEGIPLDAAGDKEYSEKLAKRIQEKTGIETKFARLAHVVRGGSPTLRDRLLAARLGDAAVEELLAGKSNLVMCLQNDQVVGMDIGYALSLDRLYKGKVKPGELEAKYTPEQIGIHSAIASSQRSRSCTRPQTAYQTDRDNLPGSCRSCCGTVPFAFGQRMPPERILRAKKCT